VLLRQVLTGNNLEYSKRTCPGGYGVGCCVPSFPFARKFMPRFLHIFGVLSLLGLTACGSPKEAPQQPQYTLTATVKDIMDSMVDPVADVIWNSVATIVSKEGVEERAPRTDEEWANVRHAAVTLAEATNLLLMPDRQVARPGEKSENPGIELEPEEIAKLIRQHPDRWAKRAAALRESAVQAIKVIDNRDVAGLIDAGEKLDQACEQCHLDHWYPNDKRPAAPPSVR